jgi:hypothetical protein
MMPLYLSDEYLAGAVKRLASSRAFPRLCDFLILKHAMAIADTTTVTLSLTDATYMTAVDQLTLAAPPDYDKVITEPYFNPFGTAREGKLGWRTKKYPSNGPPDTVNGPSWQPITEIVSQGPRVVSWREGYEDHLTAIVPETGEAPPSLLDAAAWFYRFSDLEVVAESPSDESILDAFVQAIGLTPSEQAILFPEVTL